MRCTLLKLALILASSLTFAQVPYNGLQAYYPFNGNAQDATVNGHNGIVKGATLTTDRFGNPNSAFEFDGDTIITNYTGVLGTSDRTIALWFNMSQPTTAISYLAGYGQTAAGKRFDLSLLSNTAGLDVSSSYSYYNPTITINKWYFLAVTYSSTDGTTIKAPKVYLDGVLRSTISTTTNTFTTLNTGSTEPFTIGATTTTNSFMGKLDDIRVYNRVLTPNEITSLFNENTCFKTVSVTDTLRIGSTITGLNTIPESFGMLKVYPNPSNSQITLEKSNINNDYSIRITNSLSQTVYTSVLNKSKTDIQLSSLGSKGIYYLSILDNSNKVLETKKLILE